MTTDADSHTIDPTAAAEAQAQPTQSVGEPPTRESHDADIPLWKRWLKRAHGA